VGEIYWTTIQNLTELPSGIVGFILRLERNIKMRFIMKKIIISTLILITFISCSKNPFSDGRIDPPERIEIEGTVKLSDNSDPENIFIWLEGFNLSTWTGANGKFVLKLPEIPANDDKVNGIYKIYYYMGNYKFGTSSITILDGQIERGQGDVDNNGNLKNVINLEKLLDIRTTVSPSSINVSDTLRTLEIMVSLNPFVREVDVETSVGNGGFFTAMIFLEENADTNQAVFYDAGLSMKTEVVRIDTNFKMGFKPVWFRPYFNRSLPVGKYMVIPYLYIKQNDLPADLIKAIADKADRFHYDYLKIPFRQNYGTIVVSP
jgi:hypothetical protein